MNFDSIGGDGRDYSENADLARIVLDRGQARIVVGGLPDPGVISGIFTALAEADLNLDLIVQAGAWAGATVSFTLPGPQMGPALAVLAPRLASGGGWIVRHDPIAKLSVVGVGVKAHREIAATLFDALAQVGINIDMIATSETTLSVVVGLGRANAAFDAACRAFDFPDDETEARDSAGF